MCPQKCRHMGNCCRGCKGEQCSPVEFALLHSLQVTIGRPYESKRIFYVAKQKVIYYTNYHQSEFYQVHDRDSHPFCNYCHHLPK